MADPFVAEIRIFAFNFAPKGWAMCDGQLLPISQNTALFSLLGTTYGGDGKSNFALPDMRERAPMHEGQCAGLSLHDLGEMSGTSMVTLLQTEMPLHTHTLGDHDLDLANINAPANNRVLGKSAGATIYTAPAAGKMVQMAPEALPPAGGNLPHNNMQPYLTMIFCIAQQGVFPARS